MICDTAVGKIVLSAAKMTDLKMYCRYAEHCDLISYKKGRFGLEAEPTLSVILWE